MLEVKFQWRSPPLKVMLFCFFVPSHHKNVTLSPIRIKCLNVGSHPLPCIQEWKQSKFTSPLCGNKDTKRNNPTCFWLFSGGSETTTVAVNVTTEGETWLPISFEHKSCYGDSTNKSTCRAWVSWRGRIFKLLRRVVKNLNILFKRTQINSA